MPHIDVPNDLPGIVSLFKYRPETAGPLLALADVLLHAPNTLTPGERELIATYVSALNSCEFCTLSHGAFAAVQLPGGMELVEQVRIDPGQAPISAKLRALLHVASLVQRGGREVTTEAVTAACQAGATQLEVHDTVLIAAAFCMFNRYVDGLAATTPEDPARYLSRAAEVAGAGYATLSPERVPQQTA